jgi:hypothetical protein
MCAAQNRKRKKIQMKCFMNRVYILNITELAG